MDDEGSIQLKEIEIKNNYESNINLLSNEEILKKSPYSKEASKIRLKMGIGGLSDKIKLYGVYLTLTILVFVPGLILTFFSVELWIALVIITLLTIFYFFFIHDFRENDVNKINKSSIGRRDAATNDKLYYLFENREKIAREIIEKKFPAPQLTNSKFNGVLDNCREVIESQIEILNALTPTTRTIAEIESRK